MPTRKARFLGRTAVLASIAALTLSLLTPTSVDARRLHRYGGGGGAAAAAAFVGAVGAGLAIAAARDAYAYDNGGPVYYGGGPAYGPPAYYGGGYNQGNYPYQSYGGTSPYEVCGQATTWNCQ